nr:protein reticulata-related 1, chloroplastic [Tanacetum cinerariifolium]
MTTPAVSNNALGYGMFLGIYANLRYQLLCGFDRAMVTQFDVIGVGSNPQDKQPTMNVQPTSALSTPTYVHVEENNNDQAEGEHLQDDKFTNPFCALAHEVDESSSHKIGSIWMHPRRKSFSKEYGPLFETYTSIKIFAKELHSAPPTEMRTDKDEVEYGDLYSEGIA